MQLDGGAVVYDDDDDSQRIEYYKKGREKDENDLSDFSGKEAKFSKYGSIKFRPSGQMSIKDMVTIVLSIKLVDIRITQKAIFILTRKLNGSMRLPFSQLEN